MLLMKQLWVLCFILSWESIMSQLGMMEEFNDPDGELTNCSVNLETKKQQVLLDRLINQENRLITLDIKVEWSLPLPNDTYPERMTWFLTTDDSGKHLLALDDHFIDMSLTTLSYGTAEIKLSLVQEPNDCLGNMSASDADKHLIYSLLTFPQTPAAFDDDGVNLLQLCTGSVNSDGSCCKVSILGKTVKCIRLLEDGWIDTFMHFIFVVLCVAFSQLVNVIPISLFGDLEKRSFHILGRTLKMKVKVFKGNFHGNSYKEINDFKNVNFLENVRETIEKHISLKGHRVQQHEPADHVLYTFDILSVERRNADLVSEFYPSVNVLQNIFILLKKLIQGYFILYHSEYDSRCSMFWRGIVRSFAILLYMSPIILRTVFIMWYDKQSVMQYAYCNIAFISMFLIWISIIPEENSKLLKESIKHVQQFNIGDRIQALHFILLLPLKYCRKPLFKYGLLFFSFIACLIYLVYMTIFEPILLLTLHMSNNTSKELKRRSLIANIFFFCVFYTGIISLSDTILFFTECFAYVLIGIFLNYDLILEKILLVVMILTYIVNCLSVVHRNVHHFNVKATKLVDQINKELTQKSSFATALESKKDKENTAKEVPVKNHNEKVLKVVVGSNGKPCLSVNGLFIFHDFKNPENLPVIHIPKQFTETLASKKSRFTSEPEHLLILRAVIEISVMIIALLMLFFVLRGLVRDNNESATIHTVVSVGSSAALIMLNKLLFEAEKPTFDDHNIHLKEMIKRQIRVFQDSWEDIKFGEVSECDFEYIGLPVNDSDVGLFAKLFTDENGTPKVKSFFCKLEEKDDLPKLIAKSTFLRSILILPSRRKGYENIEDSL